MRSFRDVRTVLLAVVAACGGSSATTVDAPRTGDVIADTPAIDAPAPQVATFTYAPQWSGVVSVDVLGGFGSAGDFTTPLVSLTAGSDGVFTGSAMLLPGTYPYIFEVIGDDSAGSAAGSAFPRFSVDSSVHEFEKCPAGPTFTQNPLNPCSLITVPQGAPEATFHISGKVTDNGSGAATYLVVLQREETGSHHFFANRSTTTANGKYAFDAAPGEYNIEIQNPLFNADKDSQIDPDTTDTVRRDESTAFALGSDTALPDADVTFPSYASFAPRTTGALPQTFTFPSGPPTKLDVYGPGNEVGDPFFAATAAVTDGSDSFAGTFNTTAAGSATLDGSDTYHWGIEYAAPGSGAIRWTVQSLTFPIKFPTAP